MNIPDLPTLVSWIWGQIVFTKKPQFLYFRDNWEPWLETYQRDDLACFTSFRADATREEIEKRLCTELNKSYENGRIPSSLGKCSDIIRREIK